MKRCSVEAYFRHSSCSDPFKGITHATAPVCPPKHRKSEKQEEHQRPESLAGADLLLCRMLLSILVESDDSRVMDGFLQALTQHPSSYIFWDKLHTAIRKHKDRRFVAPLRRILMEHSLREQEQEIRRILTELGEKVAP